MVPSVLVIGIVIEALEAAVAASEPDNPSPDPSPPIPVHQKIVKTERE